MKFALACKSLAMPVMQQSGNAAGDFVMVGVPKGKRRLRCLVRMIDMDKATILDSRILDWVQVTKVAASGAPSKEGSGTLDVSMDIVWDVNLVNASEAWQDKKLSAVLGGAPREEDDGYEPGGETEYTEEYTYAG